MCELNQKKSMNQLIHRSRSSWRAQQDNLALAVNADGGAKVGQLDVALRVQHEIVRLDVAGASGDMEKCACPREAPCRPLAFSRAGETHRCAKPIEWTCSMASTHSAR